MQERLQKIIAAAGIASRRKAEELITSGAVSVNGHTITELGAKADAATDDIRVAGRNVSAPEQHVYVILNKPKGYVTTTSDPEGRPTVMDLVRGDSRARNIPRLFPVGRLDFNSEGLLVLTNDGALANKLTHASSLVPKTYMVKVSGTPTEEEIERLRQGVSITADHDPKKRVRTAPARIRMTRERENPWYEVTLIEGRNRQIRKMFEEVGHHVEKIRRVRYGALELRNLDPGEWRFLTPNEVRLLYSTKQLPERPAPDVKERSRRNRSERFHTGEYPQNASGVEHRHDVEQRGPHENRGQGRGRRDFAGSRRDDDRSQRRGPRRDFTAQSDRRGPSRFGSRPERARRDSNDEYGAASIPEMGREGDRPTRRDEARSSRDDRRGQSRGFGDRNQRDQRPGKVSRSRGEGKPPKFANRRDRDERPSFRVGGQADRRESFDERPRRERPSFADRREGRPSFGGQRRDESAQKSRFGKRRDEPRREDSRASRPGGKRRNNRFGDDARGSRRGPGFSPRGERPSPPRRDFGASSESARTSRPRRDFSPSGGAPSESRGPSRGPRDSARGSAPSGSRPFGGPRKFGRSVAQDSRGPRGPRSSGRSGPRQGSQKGGRGRGPSGRPDNRSSRGPRRPR